MLVRNRAGLAWEMGSTGKTNDIFSKHRANFSLLTIFKSLLPTGLLQFRPFQAGDIVKYVGQEQVVSSTVGFTDANILCDLCFVLATLTGWTSY